VVEETRTYAKKVSETDGGFLEQTREVSANLRAGLSVNTVISLLTRSTTMKRATEIGRSPNRALKMVVGKRNGQRSEFFPSISNAHTMNTFHMSRLGSGSGGVVVVWWSRTAGARSANALRLSTSQVDDDAAV